MGVQDIIYNNTSNRYYIKCLSLFENIIKGNFFTHDTKIFKNNHQKTLIKMMDTARMNLDDFCNDDTTKQNGKKIPVYMQDLFEHCFKSIKKFGNIIWVNKQEVSKLNENVRKYYLYGDDSDSFMKWLKHKYKMKIKYTKTVSYVVQNNDDDDEDEKRNYLDSFWDGRSVILPQISYTVTNGKKQKDSIKLKLKLKKGVSKMDNTAVIMCKIVNDVLPDYCKKLKCDIGIFCPQIQFFSATAMTVSKKLQGIPLCESGKLEGLKAFEWKIFFKFKARIDSKNFIREL